MTSLRLTTSWKRSASLKDSIEVVVFLLRFDYPVWKFAQVEQVLLLTLGFLDSSSLNRSCSLLAVYSGY